MVRVLLFLGGTASEKTVGKEEGANTNKVSCFISKESAGNRESEAEKKNNFRIGQDEHVSRDIA